MVVIEFNNVIKKFEKKEVIHGLSFKIEKGEFVSLIGPSGAGKSTILNIVGLLEDYNSGEVRLNGEKIPKPDSRAATLVRRHTINYLFQSFGLINHLTVGQNLMFSMKFSKGGEDVKLKQIKKVLGSLQIEQQINATVNTLSGGEQQRVALARAMLKPGDIVLADEPTGALDPINSETAFSLIKDLRDKYGKTVLIVTHNVEEAKKTDRIINLGIA
jgi:putative ABC transport system ATP-binding protein